MQNDARMQNRKTFVH